MVDGAGRDGFLCGMEGLDVKPINPIYVGGPPLDPPDDEPVIQCTNWRCKKKFPRRYWAQNHWHCPGCHEEDAAGITEED